MKIIKLYLQDILDAIARINSFANGISEMKFKEDELIQSAVIRQIEIIGEAVKSVPPFIQKKIPKYTLERNSWYA